jgi:hypothetical protein
MPTLAVPTIGRITADQSHDRSLTPAGRDELRALAGLELIRDAGTGTDDWLDGRCDVVDFWGSNDSLGYLAAFG